MLLPTAVPELQRRAAPFEPCGPALKLWDRRDARRDAAFLPPTRVTRLPLPLDFSLPSTPPDLYKFSNRWRVPSIGLGKRLVLSSFLRPVRTPPVGISTSFDLARKEPWVSSRACLVAGGAIPTQRGRTATHLEEIRNG